MNTKNTKNTNGSKSNHSESNHSKDSSKKEDLSSENKPSKTHPLSSPNEPTRAYPSDPSRTYSSDPSQYASPPQKPHAEEPSKGYTTEPLDTARLASDHMRSSTDQARKEQEAGKNWQKEEEVKQKEEFDQYFDQYGDRESHQERTITYVLLVLGLLILIFANSLLGELMIGMVAGYYFDKDIVYYIRNLGKMTKGQGQIRYIVLAVLLLGLLIGAPGIFIGAIVVATFKQAMAGPPQA